MRLVLYLYQNKVQIQTCYGHPWVKGIGGSLCYWWWSLTALLPRVAPGGSRLIFSSKGPHLLISGPCGPVHHLLHDLTKSISFFCQTFSFKHRTVRIDLAGPICTWVRVRGRRGLMSGPRATLCTVRRDKQTLREAIWLLLGCCGWNRPVVEPALFKIRVHHCRDNKLLDKNITKHLKHMRQLWAGFRIFRGEEGCSNIFFYSLATCWIKFGSRPARGIAGWA